MSAPRRCSIRAVSGPPMTEKMNFAPVGVIKFQRHPRHDEREEAGDDEEMQEAFERFEAREPFVAGLRLEFRLAERFGVGEI